MSLPKFYREFYSKKIFTFSEFKEKFGREYSENYLRKRLNDLLNSGYFGKVKPGLYYIIPQGTSREGYIVDKFLVANKLSKNSLIGYHSALELHGAAYSPSKIVYIITERSFRSFKFQGVEYRSVKGKTSFGKTFLLREGQKLSVSDRERTLIDGISRLKYSGGVEEYFKSIEMFPYVDFKKILKYLKIYQKKVLYGKVGFILSYFAKKWNFPEKVKSKMKANLSKKIYYLTSRKEKNQLIKEWNLIVPVRLESLIKEQ